jgi:pullulanase
VPADRRRHSDDSRRRGFADQHDLFDSRGNVTHRGSKQVDPVNLSRFDEPDRRDVFEYVRRLVQLQTSHPALSVNDTDFIHVDFNDGKRVLVWKRGTDNDPPVVIANFSDFNDRKRAVTRG